ncbi:histone-fold protein CHRAC subunit [Culex quinquefasciatus]|uniref:Histone-fold protein CHRAC subunit n=2 Tax=Culex quinquefasciatus TaxID=7176 RepID=B0VZJ0_CULQU|nr:histone-fold protein CHRAC subunit [Culex quinquefasciatus]|eukprot:XP_001841874.1 histone-fold protein CHRAC subunit [Culex quinquefasciatus]
MMKTSPSIGQIAPDALFVVCRAAEMFIGYITKNAHKKGTKALDYKDLAAYVEGEDVLEFLVQILPKKITVREYKKLSAERKDEDDDDSSSSSSESESSEEESGEEGSGSDESGGEESADEQEDGAGSVISIDSSSSDEKENSKNMGNKKSPQKHKTGDSP